MKAPAVSVGIKDVVVAETSISDVLGDSGRYHYRGLDAVALARSCSLEEVWHLIHQGRLPTNREAAAYASMVAGWRTIPSGAISVLEDLTGADPLMALRAAIAAIASVLRFGNAIDESPENLERQGLIVCALLPTLVAALHRLSAGFPPVEPRSDLSHTANYLYMLHNETPNPERVRALEQYLISTMEHGFSASTFTARVIASTRADVAAAVDGALGALSGPLHGGAPGRVLGMLDSIGVPDRAGKWIRASLKRGERLMGFGHPVYKTEDPRSALLKEVARRLGGDRVDLAMKVEQIALESLAELRPGRPIRTNVEYYSAVVLESVGVPRALFTPTFAMARVIGWTAHVLEQYAARHILRPSARYVGPL